VAVRNSACHDVGGKRDERLPGADGDGYGEVLGIDRAVRRTCFLSLIFLYKKYSLTHTNLIIVLILINGQTGTHSSTRYLQQRTTLQVP
jgi:hypothetical protein